MKKLLIGGAALQALGSSRATQDVDYLVHVPESADLFIREADGELVNAAAHPFFAAVWAMEEGNIGPIASPQALLELKAFALAQHCRHGFWQKADDAEYDIRFLVRQFGLSEVRLVVDHIEAGELSEIKKIIRGVRK
jgi:hypothetical protein